MHVALAFSNRKWKGCTCISRVALN